MKIPKLVYVALLVVVSQRFPVLPDPFSLGDWSGPVFLAAVGMAVRLIDSIDPRVHTMVRGDAPNYMKRFFTE